MQIMYNGNKNLMEEISLFDGQKNNIEKRVIPVEVVKYQLPMAFRL